MRPSEYMTNVRVNFEKQPALYSLVICDSKFDFSSIPEARTVEKILIPRIKEINSTTSPSSQANSFVKIAKQKKISLPTVLVIMHQIKQEDLHDCLRILGSQNDEIHYFILGEADKLGKDSKFLFEPITKSQTFYSYNPLSADQYALLKIYPVKLSSLFVFEVKYKKSNHTELLNHQIQLLTTQYQNSSSTRIDSQTFSKIETLVNTTLLKGLRKSQNLFLFKEYSELLWKQLLAVVSFFSNPGQRINEEFEDVGRYEQALLAVIPRVAESNPIEEEWLKNFAVDTDVYFNKAYFKLNLTDDSPSTQSETSTSTTAPSTSRVNPPFKGPLQEDGTVTSTTAHGNGNKRGITEVSGFEVDKDSGESHHSAGEKAGSMSVDH
jgi:hypothetical protein